MWFVSKMILKVVYLAVAILVFSGCTSLQRTLTISDATEAELDATLVQSGDLPGWVSEGSVRTMPQGDVQNIEDAYAESGSMLCDTAPRQGPTFTSPDGKYYVASAAERVCGDVMEFARNNVENINAKADLESTMAEVGARVLEFSAAEVSVSDTLPNLVWGDTVSAITIYRITALLAIPEGNVRMERLEVAVYSPKVASTTFFEAYDVPVDRTLATRVISTIARRHGTETSTADSPGTATPPTDSIDYRGVLEQTAGAIARDANALAAFNEGRTSNETNNANIDEAVNYAALQASDGWSVDTGHRNGAQLSYGTYTVCITVQSGSPARAVVEQSPCANTANQELAWSPAGFDMVNADETLAVRWLPERDAAKMSCQDAQLCWYVEVLSRIGCSSVRVELNVVTDSGSALATITGELRANLQPDTKGIVVVKSYDSYDEYGTEPLAQIVDATCM
jgi:hypothetical protein